MGGLNVPQLFQTLNRTSGPDQGFWKLVSNQPPKNQVELGRGGLWLLGVWAVGVGGSNDGQTAHKCRYLRVGEAVSGRREPKPVGDDVPNVWEMDLTIDLLVIFLLRLVDVGLSTVRIVLLGRGRRGPAALLGFFESLIWVLAVARVLDGLDDPLRLVAFAAGFAAGTYVGSMVEEWLALGQAMVRIIAPVESTPVADKLRDEDIAATVLNGDGRDGEVRLTFCVLPRKKVSGVLRLIQKTNSEAYVTVDQTTSIDLRRQDRGVRK